MLLGEEPLIGARTGNLRHGRDDILLMTATIAPRSDTFLLRHINPQQRRDDYLRALTFYMAAMKQGAFARIVFAENSGSDLTDLRKLAIEAGVPDRISFVQVAAGPSGQYGRCYLELDLLNKAFATELVAKLPEQAMIWKVTGRYIVRNIVKLVATAPDVDIYVNSRNYPIKWTDLYLLAFRKRLFPTILGERIEDYSNLVSGEEIFRSSLDDMVGGDMRIRKRMVHVPNLQGTRGFDKGRYDSISNTAKRYLRVVANRAMPDLWI